VEVSGIPEHQTEEIDPCNISLPESDDEFNCVRDILDLRGEVEVGVEEEDEDVLPLSVAGRACVPEIAKVGDQNLSPHFRILNPFAGQRTKSPTTPRTPESSQRLRRACCGRFGDSNATNRRNRST
jgi:hypothetical protein